MEQQIAPTLWLPPGVCLLNSMPTMHLQPASALAPHQVTSQFLKHPLLTVPTTNILHNPHLLQQTQIVPATQNIIHIPVENLLLPSPGKQSFEVAPPSLVELPQCQPINLQGENQLPLPTTSTLLPSDPTFHRHHLPISKVPRKKRISPSAKRRSRLRLMAFLEQKRKQSEMNPQDDNTTLQSSPDIVTSYPEHPTTPPSSSDDVTLSPQST